MQSHHGGPGRRRHGVPVWRAAVHGRGAEVDAGVGGVGRGAGAGDHAVGGAGEDEGRGLSERESSRKHACIISKYR